jgi:NADH:ubiquinone oxidoreductase subunit 6 (subunit J)
VIRRDELTAMLPTGAAKTSVAEIGRVLVADWVVPFEAMGVLLTAALIGAVVIALEEMIRRR